MKRPVTVALRSIESFYVYIAERWPGHKCWHWYSSARPARTETSSLLIPILARRCPLLEPSLPKGVHQKRQYEEQQPRGRSTRQAGRQRQRTVSQRRVRTLHIRQDSVIPDHGGRPSGNDKARGGPGGMADAPSTGVGVGEGLAPAGCIPPENRRIARSLARRRMVCRAVVHLQATFGDSLPIKIMQASVI
jgi:hypothetical protein